MFRKIISAVLSIAVMSSSFVFAQNAVSSGTVTLIVQTEGEPTLTSAEARSYEATKKAEQLSKSQDAVINSIRTKVTADIEKGYTYTSLFNGFSIETDASYIDEIKALPGVIDVYVSGESYLPEKQLISSGELMSSVYSYDSGYYGEGEAVAVIDAGLQWDHEMFSHTPVNAKYSKDDIKSLIKSKALNAGDQITTVYKNEKIPFAYNYVSKNSDVYYSDESHGTHVSSIVCGKDGILPNGDKFSGVAPEAQLLFFGAGNNYGSFSDANSLAALNDAAALGVDVINMSFGLPYSDSKIKNLYADAIDSARAAGIYIICAAGNDAQGYENNIPSVTDIDYGTAGTSALYESSTAVASVNNTKTMSSGYEVTLADESTVFMTNAFDSSTFFELFDTERQYVDCSYGRTEDFDGKDLTGKIALIKRGELGFTTKAENAASAGAVGMIVASDSDETIYTIDLCLPTAVVTQTESVALYNAENKVITSVSPSIILTPSVVGGRPSGFSSWGTDSTLNLKPEISAPGGNIYAASTKSGYELMSGTSMAAPHITGAAALLNQYYKTNPFADSYNRLAGKDRADLFEKLMMSTADIMYQPSGVAYSPRQQGAGVLNLEKAMTSGVILTGETGKSKINLGEELGNTLNISFDVTNIGKDSVSFDNISVCVLTDGYMDAGSSGYLVDIPVSLSVTAETLTDSLTLASGASSTVSGVITLDENELLANKEIFANGFFIDGYVILTGDETVSIPFTGFYGDWHAAPAFDSTIYDDGGSTLIQADYPEYGGTFLVESYYSSTPDRILGRNPRDASIVSYDLIAINPTKGTNLGITMQNKRIIEKFVFVLCDKNGNSLGDSSFNQTTSKFYSETLTFGDWATADMPDGSYTLLIGADINSDASVDDILTFPIVYDSESPKIVSASYESGLLTVTASDNHALSTITVSYLDKYGDYVSLHHTADESAATKAFYIGEVDLSDVTITCTDYADNSTSVWAPYYTDELSAGITNFYSNTNVTTLDIKIRNNGSDTITASVVQAFYDADGRFMAAGVVPNKSLPVGETDVNYSTLNDLSKAKEFKLLILNSATTLSPYREHFFAKIE